jgi:hypothetical protein
VFTDTVTSLLVLPVELPLVGLAVSQVSLPLTDQFNVPPPEFHIAMAWLGGLDAPWVAVKLSADGSDDMVGLALVQDMPAKTKLTSSDMTTIQGKNLFIFPRR